MGCAESCFRYLYCCDQYTENDLVEALPSKMHSSPLKKGESNFGSTNECPICFEFMNEDIYALPCAHLYHRKCIEKWLNKKLCCPICYNDVFSSTA